MRRFRSVFAGILIVAAMCTTAPVLAAGAGLEGPATAWTRLVEWIGLFFGADEDAPAAGTPATAGSVPESGGTVPSPEPGWKLGPEMDPHGG
jgi:hypothetical protein